MTKRRDCIKNLSDTSTCDLSSRDFNAPKKDINGMLDDLTEVLDCFALCWGKRNATLQNPFVQQLLAKGEKRDDASRREGKWNRGKVKGLYVSSVRTCLIFYKNTGA